MHVVIVVIAVAVVVGRLTFTISDGNKIHASCIKRKEKKKNNNNNNYI